MKFSRFYDWSFFEVVLIILLNNYNYLMQVKNHTCVLMLNKNFFQKMPLYREKKLFLA